MEMSTGICAVEWGRSSLSGLIPAARQLRSARGCTWDHAGKAVTAPDAAGQRPGGGPVAHVRKRATIRQVAEATGLSTAAVSYALRGLHVSEETRLRVEQAAAELGYEADPIARALASGRTEMVGLLCGSLESLWQQSLAVGIGRTLLAHHRYARILDAADDPAPEVLPAQPLR